MRYNSKLKKLLIEECGCWITTRSKAGCEYNVDIITLKKLKKEDPLIFFHNNIYVFLKNKKNENVEIVIKDFSCHDYVTIKIEFVNDNERIEIKIDLEDVDFNNLECERINSRIRLALEKYINKMIKEGVSYEEIKSDLYGFGFIPDLEGN